MSDNYEIDPTVETKVFNPHKSTFLYQRLADEVRNGENISVGAQSLQSELVPIRKGKVVGVMARSGHGKTTYMSILAKLNANIILDDGADDSYIGYVSYETPIEEIEAVFSLPPNRSVTDLARGLIPQKEVEEYAIQRRKLPLWLFGNSVYETNMRDKPMSIERLADAIELTGKKHGRYPKALFIDYIQRIPVEKHKDRYMQVTEAMYLVRDLATYFKCAIFLGIQANQRVDDQQIPIPGMRDAEWSAVITQDVDTCFSLWRPIRTYPIYEKRTIKINDHEYPNNDELLIIKLLKQRWGAANICFPVNMNMGMMSISDINKTTYSAPPPKDIPFLKKQQ